MNHSMVNWNEWSPSVFERALNEKKPVLLDISAVWCHWCHVMDETTYGDANVADQINTRFLPVRVDADRRPDINDRYMQSGWPSTVFLTPRGQVIYGATYLPADQMREVMDQVSAWYEKHGEEVTGQVPERLVPEIEEPPASADFSPMMIERVVEKLLMEYDEEYGGFGEQAKFPLPAVNRLLLTEGWATGIPSLTRAALDTLRRMALEGLLDRHEGGFFRYSTSRDWSVPHYEKMLEDNAGLLMNYVTAYESTGRTEESFLEFAEAVIRYVEKSLSAPDEGGFYGSQDAGDESYYHLPPEKRTPDRAPRIDRTLYTGWNMKIVSAYARAGTAFDQKGQHLLRKAEAVFARFLTETVNTEMKVKHTLGETKEEDTLYLRDILPMAQAALDLHEATGKNQYRETALRLGDSMIRDFYDSQGWGFVDMVIPKDAVGMLYFPLKQIHENGQAAQTLLRLGVMTGNTRYRELARQSLTRFLEIYQEHPWYAADYALALRMYLSSPLHAVIVGERDHPETELLLKAAQRAYVPAWIAIECLDPKETANQKRLKELGHKETAAPTLYPCVGHVCGAPMTAEKNDAQNIIRRLEEQIKSAPAEK